MTAYMWINIAVTIAGFVFTAGVARGVIRSDREWLKEVLGALRDDIIRAHGRIDDIKKGN